MNFVVNKSLSGSKYVIWNKVDLQLAYLPLTRFNKIMKVMNINEIEEQFIKHDGYVDINDSGYIIDYWFNSNSSANKFLKNVFIPNFIAWKLI